MEEILWKENKYYELENETFCLLNLNQQKGKIVLSGHNYSNGSNKYTLNIGLIDDNLEISNLSNIVSIEKNNEATRFEGRSEDGGSFYMSSRIKDEEDESSNAIYNFYEVYGIMN